MKKLGIFAIVTLALIAGRGALHAEKLADLTIGLMPAYNSIPLVVAKAGKLFESNGIDVTLVPFNGQLERETALQTGALDGTISDLINAIQSWTHGFGSRVTSVTEGNFSLLSSPHSTLRSLSDWPSGNRPRVRTGLLENSIVYYLTERMLMSAGADPARLELVPIVQLPARVEMLLADKVDAACLPEPLATLAASRGAHVLADADALGTAPGVLLFTKKALVEKRSKIIAFYRSYDEAVEAVNARPDSYRQSIVTECGFPPSVSGLIRIPRFQHAFLPPEQLVADVARWMVDKALSKNVPAYPEIVDPVFASSNARAE
jgi:NitT/TauT family transport system substrate-binding protein